MRLLNLVQGSDDWLVARAQHFCASDCAAMKGDSKDKSRNQLLLEKKTGNREEISATKQAIFDKGHEAEAKARNIVEMSLVEDFAPVVGILEVDGLSLLASLDGLSEDGQLIFEHKLFNQTLAENVRNRVLEASHYWQLEQQLLVFGAKEVIFVCSDGTEDKIVSMTYVSVPERRACLMAGWKQFAKDLEEYEVEAKREVVVGVSAEAFPAITYKVEGSMVISNIADVLPVIKERAELEMNRVLDTDQDFADKESLNKATVKARTMLKEVVASAKGEFVSFSEFAETAEQIDAVLQKMQSRGEKQVKQAKDAKKAAIESAGQEAINSYVSECNEKIEPLTLFRIGVSVLPDFKQAMKGKRTIESLTSAVDTLVASAKIEIDQAMARIVPNQVYLKGNAVAFSFLFADVAQIINQDIEPFQAIVKSRIADHEAAEEKKAKELREEIRKDEELKAENNLKCNGLIKSWHDAANQCNESQDIEEVRTLYNFLADALCDIAVFGNRCKEALNVRMSCRQTAKDRLEALTPEPPQEVESPQEAQSHVPDKTPLPDSKAKPAVESSTPPEVEQKPTPVKRNLSDDMEAWAKRHFVSGLAMGELEEIFKHYTGHGLNEAA